MRDINPGIQYIDLSEVIFNLKGTDETDETKIPYDIYKKFLTNKPIYLANIKATNTSSLIEGTIISGFFTKFISSEGKVGFSAIMDDNETGGSFSLCGYVVDYGEGDYNIYFRVAGISLL